MMNVASKGSRRRWAWGALAALTLGFAPPAMGAVPSSARSRRVVDEVRPRLEPQLNKAGFQWGAPMYVRIYKRSKQLEVWLQRDGAFKLFRTYAICTYSGQLGPKTKQGDLQAPEGFYFVTPRRLNPYSRFHLSFNLGYPNAYDRVHRRTGSALMVHGNCVSIGCFAMTDARIEEIYTLADAAFRAGQPFFRAHVFPFRMTQDNLRPYARSKHKAFWDNLKEGYDFFDEHGRPPNVEVRGGRYVFD